MLRTKWIIRKRVLVFWILVLFVCGDNTTIVHLIMLNLKFGRFSKINPIYQTASILSFVRFFHIFISFADFVILLGKCCMCMMAIHEWSRRDAREFQPTKRAYSLILWTSIAGLEEVVGKGGGQSPKLKPPHFQDMFVSEWSIGKQWTTYLRSPIAPWRAARCRTLVQHDVCPKSSCLAEVHRQQDQLDFKFEHPIWGQTWDSPCCHFCDFKSNVLWKINSAGHPVHHQHPRVHDCIAVCCSECFSNKLTPRSWF